MESSYCIICSRPASLRLRNAIDIRICNRGTNCQHLVEQCIKVGHKVRQTRRLAPPVDVQASLIEHFYVMDSAPPENLEIRASKTLDPNGFGIFATQFISKNATIGRYGGTVLFTERAVDEREMTSAVSRIFDIQVKNYVVWIDGEIRSDDLGYTHSFITWQSRINHQWQWRGPPEASVLPSTKTGGLFLTQENIPFAELIIFANCEVLNDTGDIIALRNIAKNEELTIDYGRSYWKGEKPRWDWTKLPLSSEKQLRALASGNTDIADELRELLSLSNLFVTIF